MKILSICLIAVFLSSCATRNGIDDLTAALVIGATLQKYNNKCINQPKNWC